MTAHGPEPTPKATIRIVNERAHTVRHLNPGLLADLIYAREIELKMGQAASEERVVASLEAQPGGVISPVADSS